MNIIFVLVLLALTMFVSFYKSNFYSTCQTDTTRLYPSGRIPAMDYLAKTDVFRNYINNDPNKIT